MTNDSHIRTPEARGSRRPRRRHIALGARVVGDGRRLRRRRQRDRDGPDASSATPAGCPASSPSASHPTSGPARTARPTTRSRSEPGDRRPDGAGPSLRERGRRDRQRFQRHLFGLAGGVRRRATAARSSTSVPPSRLTSVAPASGSSAAARRPNAAVVSRRPGAPGRSLLGISPAVQVGLCGNGVGVIGSGSTADVHEHAARDHEGPEHDGDLPRHRRRDLRQRRRRHRLRQHRHVRQHPGRPAPAGTTETSANDGNGSLADVSPAAQADVCGNGVAVIGSGSTATCDNTQKATTSGNAQQRAASPTCHRPRRPTRAATASPSSAPAAPPRATTPRA